MIDLLEIFAFTLWTIFIVYATWYFTSAKHFAPITHYEAKILWRIHKQNVRCVGRKWREVRHRGKIVGFECECGYKHVQKRPIIISPPSAETPSQNPQVIVFDKLHTSYKST